MTDEKQTMETLQAQIEEQKTIIANYAEKMKTAKFVKEVSEVFRNKTTNQAMKFSSLSETKKHFETTQLDYCLSLVKRNDNTLLTSAEFHALVIADLKL